jgi:hypothetical protein
MTHEEMAEALAVEMVDGMDIDTLVMYAVDNLRNYYSTLSTAELHKEVEEFYPHLLEEN